MELKDISKLGARKYFEDGGVYRNPYPAATPEADEFERGWMQALKRDNGGTVPAAAKQDALPDDWLQDHQRSAAKLSAERYRSLKE